MTKRRQRCDTRNYPAASLLQASMHLGPPGGTSIQAMVAKWRSLVQRFPGACLTQFIRHYNWICSCINKKSAKVATNCKRVACADTTGDPLGAAFGFSRLCLNRCRRRRILPFPSTDTLPAAVLFGKLLSSFLPLAFPLDRRRESRIRSSSNDSNSRLDLSPRFGSPSFS